MTITTPAQIIGAAENTKNNRYFIRAFLIDDTVNKNKVGHRADYLAQHINKFVGRPLIVTDYLKHPHEFYHIPETGIPDADIKMYLERQEPYSIGVVKSVLRNKRLVQNSVVNSYDAIIELLDAKAIAAYKEGKIPRYVSPSIYRLNRNDPPDAITDFEPINITIVDDPAYGFHNASVRNSCEGTNDVCTRLLTQNASSQWIDYSKIKNLFQNSGTLNSSYFNSTANLPVNLTEESPNNSNNNTANTAVNNPSTSTESQSQQQPQQTLDKGMTVTIPSGQTLLNETDIPKQPQQEQQQLPASTESPRVEAANPAPNTKQDEQQESPCQKTIARWEAKLDEAFQLIQKQNKVIEGLSQFKETSEKNIAEVRANTKRSKISSIVSLDSTGGNEEERTKRIESLMALPDEQLDHFLNTYVIPMSRPQPTGRGLAQSGTGTLGFRPKVTEMIENNNNKKDDNRNLQQSATKTVSQKDIDELNELLNFGSIVGNSNEQGGVY